MASLMVIFHKWHIRKFVCPADLANIKCFDIFTHLTDQYHGLILWVKQLDLSSCQNNVLHPKYVEILGKKAAIRG